MSLVPAFREPHGRAAMGAVCPCWRAPDSSPCCVWTHNTQVCHCVDEALGGALPS
jgi:hypothetical protein